MEKILINFSDENYLNVRRINSYTGKIIAHFNKIYEFSPADIDSIFFNENINILKQKRGHGLWLWKPYFINKVLNESENGDIIFYSDSAAFFVRKIDKIIQSMGDDEIWLYGLPLIEEQWTKPEAFSLLSLDYDSIKQTNQFSGSFMVFRVGDKSKAFVKEWLKYCCNQELIMPKDGDSSGHFISHREDQSILSLLAKKHNLKMHKDPTQYGKFVEGYKNEGRTFRPLKILTEDCYPVVLSHHREKQLSWKMIIVQMFIIFFPKKIVQFKYYKDK